MVLPTTYASALLLVLASFFCFCAWPCLYKLTERRWRFEYFSIDFAIACFLISLLICFTLGVAGSGLPFSDRLVLVGRSTAFWGVASGLLFGFANLALWGAASLLSVAAALPLVFGLALAITLLFRVRDGGLPVLICGVLFFAASSLFGLRTAAARLPANRRANFRRGRLLAILGGVAMGACLPLLRTVLNPDNGPGPYIAFLGLCTGVFVAIVGITFFSVNLPIIGAPPGLPRYFSSPSQLHAPGLAAGLLWALGAFSIFLGANAAPDVGISPTVLLIVPLLSVLVCIGLGALRWNEVSGVPVAARRELAIAVICFVIGLTAAGWAVKS